MTDHTAQKLRAVEAAIAMLPERGTIGLGTGSTAELFIEQLAKLVRAGRRYDCVATSIRSHKLAEELKLKLLDDVGPWEIDVCVDGADEVSQELCLIKGGGACHLREKIVNASSKFNIIVVDESKMSECLGSRWAVPVEVDPFGHLATAHHLGQFGKVAARRMKTASAASAFAGNSSDKIEAEPGELLRTDSGHYIYDVKTGPIEEPGKLDAKIRQIPGVVDTGLFVGRVSRVIVAGADYIRVLERN